MGVPPGSRVAYFGRSDISQDYWARLGGSWIVADIQKEDMPQFWNAPPAVRSDILARLAPLDVRAAIASDCPADTWKPIAGTGFCVYLLSNSTLASASK